MKTRSRNRSVASISRPSGQGPDAAFEPVHIAVATGARDNHRDDSKNAFVTNSL